LVGDHRQLSSVDAGGAFGLLATQTSAVELTSLWRFDHAWEATAGQQLRIGNTDCIDTYAAHGRLHDGPAEAMTAEAYSAWETAIRHGRSALLIAADNATLADLNTRARATRVRIGAVEPDGVGLHDDTVAGVGVSACASTYSPFSSRSLPTCLRKAMCASTSSGARCPIGRKGRRGAGQSFSTSNHSAGSETARTPHGRKELDCAPTPLK
jgi:hypothetical protein